MTVPFADAGSAEVWARVVFQLVKREYRGPELETRTPGQIISQVIRDLNALQLSDLRFAATSMYYACVTKRQVSCKWLSTVCERSRGGHSFRAALYFDYKATRRDPRVTNRGVGKVQLSLPGAELPPLCEVCQEVDCEC